MKIDDFVKDAQSIAITGHVKPDGDCVGSVLAFYNYVTVNYPDRMVDLYLEDPDHKFRFLKNFDRIDSRYEKDSAYDLVVVLDCSTRERMGEAEKYFRNAKKTVCIDHHVSNLGYADENYIDGEISSASELLYQYLEPSKLDREIATCLYTGIISDTGVFKYPATSPETMRAAAALMEYGVDTEFVINEGFYAKDYQENRILGYAVMNSRLACDGRVIYSCITREDMERFGVTTKELDGIVAQLKLTRGVQCALFFYETGACQFKVSLRTAEPVDANEAAKTFGGGGHVRAAGCNVRGDAETVLEALLTVVGRQLD